MPILKCLSSHVRSVSYSHKKRKNTCRKFKLRMGVVRLCWELMLGCVGFEVQDLNPSRYVIHLGKV